MFSDHKNEKKKDTINKTYHESFMEIYTQYKYVMYICILQPDQGTKNFKNR